MRGLGERGGWEDTPEAVPSRCSRSSWELGLRLRYEIRREFAPYIGIERAYRFGNTADIARAAGDAVHETRWVAGLRVWF